MVTYRISYIYSISLLSIFVQAIWKRLYWEDSSRDKGTLHHLKHVLNRTSVHKDPGKDLKAAEDFFTLVWEAQVMSAAQSVKSTQGEEETLAPLCRKVMDSFVLLSSLLAQR